jgi:chromosome segregation ATPase
LVPEVAALGDEAPDRLEDLVRILDGGMLIVGTVAGAGVAYDTLYRWLFDRFEHVRIYGEASFEGVAVADFEAGAEPEIVVDGSLIEAARPPRAFIALASDAPLEDAPAYTVLELPDAGTPASPRDESGELQAQIDAAVEHAEGLEAEVERLRRALDMASRDLESAQREAAEARARATAAEAREPRERRDPLADEAVREATREVEALEARLVERAHHVQALEAEVERRGLLVRDAVEEARELRRLGSGDPSAVERALAAEAARAEAQFQVDELQAQLNECLEGRAGATPTEADLEALERREAELYGRARGLQSRLFELSELHELALGRLSLAEAARDERLEKERRLERELLETQEQLELALVKARGRVGEDAREARLQELTLSEERLSARVGELSNQLVAAQDLANALRASSEVPAAPTASDADLERLRGREIGLRFRLANAERAFDARAVAARRGAVAVDTVDALRTEVAAIQAENSALTIQLADLRQSEGGLRVRAGDLTSALAARDALVTRLQLELSQVEQQVKLARQQKARLEEDTNDLRAAVVDAAMAVEAREHAERELESLRPQLGALEERAQRAETARRELEERLATERASSAATAENDERILSLEAEHEVLKAHAEAVERERDDARTLLAETRAALEGLRSGQAAEGQAGQGADLGRELRDRDLLLRSLTAQLEERSDRIRALERRLSGSLPAAPPDDEMMRRQLLELQERSVRLAEELAAERDARRMSESRLVQLESRPAVDQELGRVRDELGRSRRDLDLEKSRAESFERDVRSLREVCVEARQGLEALLGGATSAGDQETADRLGRLLTILGRY